jgi:hypothetical protein
MYPKKILLKSDNIFGKNTGLTFDPNYLITWPIVTLFNWGRKPEYSEKTTDLSQVAHKLYHIMLYRVHLVWTGFKLTTLVVILKKMPGTCLFLFFINRRPCGWALFVKECARHVKFTNWSDPRQSHKQTEHVPDNPSHTKSSTPHVPHNFIIKYPNFNFEI